MKFITEGDLRDLYRKEPYSTYQLEAEARLTPGARQYLADLKIQYDDYHSGNKKKKQKGNVKVGVMTKKNSKPNMVLHSKLKSIEALFLLTGNELLSKDASLAHSIVKHTKQLSCIRYAILHNGSVEHLSCNECPGITINNFSEQLEDCFEITDFHMQLEKGREILSLHRLRCALQEIEPIVQDLSLTNPEEILMDGEITSKVNQLINSLSQLICSVIGGEKCQKKT